jgi:hypothetical protein
LRTKTQENRREKHWHARWGEIISQPMLALQAREKGTTMGITRLTPLPLVNRRERRRWITWSSIDRVQPVRPETPYQPISPVGSILR